MIKVRNLTKDFKVEDKTFRAVDNVSFDVEKGEVYGIIGLSGAGKSTLVRCLNFLEKPSSGTVEIDGVKLNGLDKKDLLKLRQNIGMIFQGFNLFHQRTVAENIAYPLEIIGLSKHEIQERVAEMLEFVDLVDRKNHYPSEISGGQKQRVAIARALATKPKVLLSDESTSALDPANTEQILNLLKSSVDKFGMTVVLITHQMEVAKNICDRIAVMERGAVIEEGDVEDIFNNPKTDRTKSFIRSLPGYVDEDIFNPADFHGRIFQLNFKGENTTQPIINEVMKSSKCSVNIISGNMNTVRSDEKVGYLILEIDGEPADIDETVRKLAEKVVVEEIR